MHSETEHRFTSPTTYISTTMILVPYGQASKRITFDTLFFDIHIRYSKTIRKDLQQPFSTNGKSCRPFSNDLTLMLDKTKNDSKTQR